jgi:hypothetical protein
MTEKMYNSTEVNKLLTEMQAKMNLSLEQQEQKFAAQMEQLKNQTQTELNNSNISTDVRQNETMELLARTLHEMSMNAQRQMKRQERIDNQLIYQELPVVTNVGLEWTNFYEIFTKSKNYFEHAQNVIRIQKAIKCPTLLQAAGANLFSEKSYTEAIELLNDRFNRPFDILRNELKNVLKLTSPQEHDYVALVDYITAIQHYASMQKNIGNINTQSDSGIINNLIIKLPAIYRLKWNSLCAAKEKLMSLALNDEERSQNTITVMTLSEFLGKNLDGLTRAISMFDTTQIEHDQEPQHKFENYPKNPWDFSCWLCRTDSHDIHECYKAKSISGTTLFSKLQKLNMCCKCFREKYTGRNHVCSYPSPPECKEARHEGKFHWWLMCPLRKVETQNYLKIDSFSHDSSEGSQESHIYDNTEIDEITDCPDDMMQGNAKLNTVTSSRIQNEIATQHTQTLARPSYQTNQVRDFSNYGISAHFGVITRNFSLETENVKKTEQLDDQLDHEIKDKSSLTIIDEGKEPTQNIIDEKKDSKIKTFTNKISGLCLAGLCLIPLILASCMISYANINSSSLKLFNVSITNEIYIDIDTKSDLRILFDELKDMNMTHKSTYLEIFYIINEVAYHTTRCNISSQIHKSERLNKDFIYCSTTNINIQRSHRKTKRRKSSP